MSAGSSPVVWVSQSLVLRVSDLVSFEEPGELCTVLVLAVAGCVPNFPAAKQNAGARQKPEKTRSSASSLAAWLPACLGRFFEVPFACELPCLLNQCGVPSTFLKRKSNHAFVGSLTGFCGALRG